MGADTSYFINTFYIMERFIKYLDVPLSVSPYERNTNIIPAIIAAGAMLAASAVSAASSASSARSQRAAQRETNDANILAVREANQGNLDLYREQYRDSLKQWERQNAYDSPLQQKARLLDAGINPAMAITNYQGSPASLPSAPTMQASHTDMPPAESFSDSFIGNFAGQLPSLVDSLGRLQDYNSKSIDNQTRDAMNKAQIKSMLADIDYKLSQSKVARVERKRLLAAKDALEFQLGLDKAKYDDSLKLSNLQVKFQEIQNRVLDDQNTRDAARLAIEQYEAVSHHRLTEAQINQIKVLSNIAVSTDWRNAQSHVLDMNLKALDEVMKRLQVDDKSKQVIFEEVMRQSEMLHTGLKDASVINKLAERAFGLGFRDIGTAIRTLISK